MYIWFVKSKTFEQLNWSTTWPGFETKKFFLSFYRQKWEKRLTFQTRFFLVNDFSNWLLIWTFEACSMQLWKFLEPTKYRMYFKLSNSVSFFLTFLLFLPYFFIRCISLLSDSSDSMSSEELFTVEKIRGRRRTPSG